MIALSSLRSSPLRPRPKSAPRLALILCPILLVISCYGFGRFFQFLQTQEPAAFEHIFFLLVLAFLPMTVAAILAVVAAQRLEYDRLAFSYQTRIDQTQRRLNAQEDLLHVLMDRNPESVLLFDRENRIWFANLSAALDLKTDVKSMLGQFPMQLLSADRGRPLELRLNQVRTSGHAIDALDQIKTETGHIRFMQSHYEMVPAFGDFVGGVLARSSDVTNLLVERERRETMLRQVIATLVAVVDRRDPYASGHSERVGRLSRALAEEMTLNEKDIDAAEIAGSLMNFGKVLVPRDILTKTTALTPDELKQVRESMLASADILSIIDFVGPVSITLKQVLERFDGTGVPFGLKGDQILSTARIVTLANAYIALVSPRAHRPSVGFDEAVAILLRDADRLYDRRIIEALAHVMANRPNILDVQPVGTQN